MTTEREPRVQNKLESREEQCCNSSTVVQVNSIGLVKSLELSIDLNIQECLTGSTKYNPQHP